jgi:hypothetical protein
MDGSAAALTCAIGRAEVIDNGMATRYGVL